MKVKLHKYQYEIATDTHRFKVIVAGRRFGKSVLARLCVLKWAIDNPGLYWIVSPTFQMAKDIHWLQGFKSEIPSQMVSKWNEADLSVTLFNGAVIQLKSAENPDRLKGVKLKGLIVDEIAQLRNWDWIWKEALRPTLVDYQSPAMFISTPKGFNEFHKLAKLGDHNNIIESGGMDEVNPDEDFQTWRFTSYDNPYIPKKEIDTAERQTTKEYFGQEYLAKFTKYVGLVYKEFQREVNVIEPFEIPEGWSIYRAIDFGSTNPTACLWIAVDGDDNWYIYQEHYQTGETIDYHAGVINSKSQRSCTATYGDPSGAQWISEFAQRGIYITPANKEVGTNFNSWVRYGIEKVNEKLKIIPGRMVALPQGSHQTQNASVAGLPSLFIFNNCTNVIREFETYRWKEKSVTQAQDLNEPDVPEKANDHALDSLRYFAVSYKGKPVEYKVPETDITKQNWSLE